MKNRETASFESRKRLILEHLTKKGEVTIHYIAGICKVSSITARRDLDQLENLGLLKRTHGGAIKPESPQKIFSFDIKAKLNKEKKERIAEAAAGFIEEGDIIYMDCGTTVYYLTKYIPRFRDVRIITNSLPVVAELSNYTQIRINLIGGELDHERKALYGPMTESFLEKYRANKAFIGAAGVTLKNGLTANGEKESVITGKMAHIAEKVFLLCDSTKIGKDSFTAYAPVSIVDAILTDADADPLLISQFREQNIQIITI